MSKMIQFQNATFWTDASEILFCEFSNEDPSHKLKLKGVKLYIEAIVTLCNGKPMPFLIDLRGTRGTFSISAAKLLAKSKDLINLRISESYVTNTIAIRLLIASYKRLYDPHTPFSIFNNIEDAKDFCNEYKKKVHGSV